MRFCIAYERTFMFLREILKKKIFFETAKIFFDPCGGVHEKNFRKKKISENFFFRNIISLS